MRGVAGGYQLRAGGQLPPLLLEDEEAVAIAVGLRTAAAGSVGGLEETSVQALTKVISLMPPRLRRRMDALKSQTESPGPWAGAPVVDAAVLTTLAQACRDDEPLKFDYTARESEKTHRWVEPHRLVSLGRRWYLVAYDRDRQDWRSFRVDRIAKAASSGQRFRPRELPAKDALSFVQSGFKQIPQRYAVRVRFEASAEVVDAFVGRWAQIEPDGDTACVMTMNTDTLDWPMFVLANIDAEFRIEGPPELVDQVSNVADRLGRSSASWRPARLDTRTTSTRLL